MQTDRSNDPRAKKRRKLKDNGHTGNEGQKRISDLLRGQKDNTTRSRDPKEAQTSPDHPQAKTSLPTSNSPQKMYSFAAKSSTNAVIDLTKSSPTSPTFPSGSRKIHGDGFSRQNAFTPHQGAKKLVVKNLRPPRADPNEYYRKTWDKIQAALETILSGQRANHSLEELYRGAENLARQGRSPEMYTQLRDRCQTYLSGHIRQDMVGKASRLSSIDFLSTYLESWKAWCSRLVTVKFIFSFMDQTYLLRTHDKPRLTEMGNDLFRNIIFRDASIRSKVMEGLMDLIELDRKLMADERALDLLKRSISMLHELSSYATDFEPAFMTRSMSFLTRWANEETEKQDLKAYAQGCQELSAREMARCDLYGFDRQTRAQLFKLLDQLLAEERLVFLTDKDSVRHLLERHEVKTLKDVYSLMERVKKGADLRPVFESFILDEGSAIVFDEPRESEMVVRLLDFKKKLNKILELCFDSNQKISDGLHQSFEQMMNKTKKTAANWDTDNSKPGEMIAKHVDLLLKGGVRALPRISSSTSEATASGQHDFDDDREADDDAQINHHLSLALDLFRFVHGKAVFEAFYKKDLARRLLMGRSASNDAERNMLTRLRTECGSQFTHNLESMFKDMDLARDEMNSFTQLQNDRGIRNPGPDLNVSVLSSGSWPTYPDVPVTVPTAISKLLSEFESHYRLKHSGRTLTWKHALTHCQLKANYPKNTRKELVVSGFQAIVLLLFNDLPTSTDPSQPSTLSYQDLLTATSLPQPELNRTLQSLACGKHRVLLKHPRGRDISSTDTFSYNAAFKDPKTHIKINQIQLKETREENKETHIRVAADRHYETQAAVVRIMKSRKTIGHAELVAEVIRATWSRGVLDPVDIKKNIDRLIEKEYMERGDEKNTYSYVA